MEDFLFSGAIASIFVLVGIWAVQRGRQMRRQAQEREQAALRGFTVAAASAQKSPPNARQAATDFAQSEPVLGGGIEVAEMSEVIDLESLLSSVPPRVAAAARDVLDEPTNIEVPPAALSASRLSAPQTATAPAVAPMVVPVTMPKPAAEAPMPRPNRSVPPRPTLASLISKAPLRELVLTWYRARGYSTSPASPALRPIECVLRHRSDVGRAYAVVFQVGRVSAAQVDVWLRQARSIGLTRLLVVAEAGADAAAEAQKGVRILDRTRIEAEIQRLDPQVAARIIALVSAGARATEPALGRG
jgi:hypothetical protein